LRDNPLSIGNDVNELMIVNRSNKPLYLMPGEIIIGGDQDRTIGQELVVAPDGKPVPLDVFCVEHGRWGGRTAQDYAHITETITAEDRRDVALTLDVSQTQQLHALTDAANAGKFVGSIGSLNKGARLAVQSGAGQSKVWEEVGKENAKSRVSPASGAFTANYAARASVERLDRYLDKLQQPIADEPRVVGAIVAVNGKVESMDVFESTPLFRKLWPKLLKSYALDAANAEAPEGKVAAAERDDAIRFVRDVARTKADKTEANQDVAVVQGENERVLIFSSHQFDSEHMEIDNFQGKPAASAGYGGFSGGIHGAAFSK
jgi:hypothetical protein